MLQLLRNFLADLSVDRKLMFAFGLLALLSLAAIGIAFRSSNILLSYAMQGQAIAKINLLLLQARGAEKDFALKHRQDKAEQVTQLIAELGTQVDMLMRSSHSNDLSSLVAVRDSSREYLNQFASFMASSNQAEQALTEMRTQAGEARIQFEFVELDMFSAIRESILNQREVESATLTLAENAATLLRMLLAIRVAEFEYVGIGDGKSFEAWESLVDGATGEVSRLKSRVNSDNLDIVQAAQKALAQYRSAFDSYRRSRSANEQSALVMRQLAEKVLQQADHTLAEHQKAMEGKADSVVRLLFVSGVIILVLSIMASWIFRQLILPPLKQTLVLAQRIAAGDLSQNITTGRKDELGQLCQAMDVMGMNLRGLVLRITDGIEQLHFSAEELQGASIQNNEGALAQQRETELAAASTQQMACSAVAISRHAGEASEAAKHANQQTSDGERVVRQSAEQIGLLALGVEGSMQTIQRLHQGSERIGGVLDVIKAVAGQTNLLALNAAIEAARAGEQGRGFAVVADEVRALAQRTQHSAQEIEELISELQAMSEDAVRQMAESVQLSHQAVSLGQEAQQALALITTAMNSIESLNQRIATAADEQSLMADEISQNVHRVHGIADQGAHSTGRIAASSAALTNLGGELQQLVKQFRAR